MHSRLLVLAIVLSLGACGGGTASQTTITTTTTSGDGHAIHLARQIPVGYAWGETTHYASTQRETVSAGGTIVRDTTTNTTIDLGGEYTVLGLAPSGEPMRLRLAIDHVTVDTGAGITTPPLPAVIVIDRGTPGSIAGENGEAIAAETIEMLHHVVPEHARPMDDDAVFGTREPQAVGATWPLDAQGAARGLAALQLTVDPSNVHGGTTLVSVGNEAGIDVLVLHTVINASHIAFPGLPQGSIEQRADVQAEVQVVLPESVALPPLRETESSAVDIEVQIPTGSGGPMADLTFAIREQVTHTRTLR